METQTTMVAVPKYHAVNSKWPDGTNDGRDLKPTPQEAIAAARKLYRYALKRTFKGKVVLTSGRRYTWIRNHVMYVNPDEKHHGGNGGGWHELVHSMSHLCSRRLYPNAPGHGAAHESLERDMICHVIESGWLDGKLKREPRPAKPAPDAKLVKSQKIEASIRRWTTKLRRAEMALKKLKRKQARLLAAK